MCLCLFCQMRSRHNSGAQHCHFLSQCNFFFKLGTFEKPASSLMFCFFFNYWWNCVFCLWCGPKVIKIWQEIYKYETASPLEIAFQRQDATIQSIVEAKTIAKLNTAYFHSWRGNAIFQIQGSHWIIRPILGLHLFFLLLCKQFFTSDIVTLNQNGTIWVLQDVY